MLKFKKDVECRYTSEFWYDITEGYIVPSHFLEKDDAEKVADAVELIKQFIDEAKDSNLIETI